MLVEYQTLWHVYLSASALLISLMALMLRLYRWSLMKLLVLVWFSVALLMPSLQPEAENWRSPALIKWVFLQIFSEQKGQVPFPAEVVAVALLITVGCLLFGLLIRFVRGRFKKYA